MTSPTNGLSAPAPRYEMRPSPLKAWNENAPDEVVPVGENAPGIGDFLQALNPLQHLPVIGSAYRALTGATIEPAARVVGGLIFGGPLGMIGSLVNAFVEEDSGADVTGHLMAMVGAGKEPGVTAPAAPPTQAPATDGGLLHFASFSAAGRGSVERGTLLTTWIAEGAPTGHALAAAPTVEPSRAVSPGGIPIQMAARRPEPEAAPVAAAALPSAPAPTSAAAVAPAMPPEPAHGDTKGKSLRDYREASVAPVGFRAAAATAVDNFGLGRRAESARKLAMQTQAAAVPALSPALQVQDVARAGDAAPQNYFTAAMVAGLERYRDMQRRRDAAAPAEGI